MSLIANYAFNGTDYNSGSGTTFIQSGNGYNLTKINSGVFELQLIHLLIVMFMV